MRRYAQAFKISVSVLLAIVVFCMSSCGVKTEKISGASRKEILSSGEKYTSTLKHGSVKAASSDNKELYFDPENGCVSFYDKLSGRSWNSLPEFDNDFASVLTVKVLKDSVIYELDFTASLENGTEIVYETSDNSLKVSYDFAFEGISVCIPVVYSLDGAFFSAVIDMASVETSENARLLSIEFMPYMGAVRYDGADIDFNVFGDWFLVPDGPGALMYTAVEDETTAELVFSSGRNENTLYADISAYAVNQQGALLTAVITDGEENTLINAIRSNADEKNVNRIYPEFIVTEVSGEEGNIRVGSSYTGKFTVYYEALAAGTENFTAAAVSVRQMLYGSGIMKNNVNEDEYPLYISLTGSVDGKKDTSVTSYSQAENLLTLLKGKGINDVNLILEGSLSGGLQQKKPSSVNVLSSLGGKEEFSELCSYAASQKLNLFMGVNLFSCSSPSAAAKDINGDKYISVRSNPLAPVFGNESYELTALGNKAVRNYVSSFIRKSEKLGFPGVCILDEGYINGDFSSEDTSASATAGVYENSISALSVPMDIMLSSAGSNTLMHADYLRGIRFYTSVEENGYYVAVPFIPAILHSSVIYAGEPVNLSSASVLQLLKAVEYGAMPYYSWCFDPSSDKYYENGLSEAVEFYNKAEKNLGDLVSKRITNHFRYDDGVFCTEYEGGVKVYVNYNNYSVVIGDVAVLPYDYLRIG